MEKFDLTKCNNCRFRAEMSNSGPVSGRIVVGKGVYFVDEDGNYIGVANSVGEEIIGINGCAVTDFEIVPRDPETYRDWQVGDIIRATDGNTGRIIFRSGDFVAADIEGTCMCYTCEEMHGSGWRLALTDIEQQIIEGKKKYEPQDGDIVAWQSKKNPAGWAISIYKEKDGSYMTLFTTGSCRATDYTLDMQVIRPATDEEKQLLFDAMAKEGKRWNAEKKVVEDIPKPYEFKKGEPVLVRNHDYELWSLFAYHEQAGDKHIVKTCFQTILQSQCIPYNERTMHLLGTSEDYKEDL